MAFTPCVGNGDGTFQNGSGTWGFTTYSASVAVADFNGDGHIDFAVAGNSYPTVSVLLGNGDGTFQTATYAVGLSGVSTSILRRCRLEGLHHSRHASRRLVTRYQHATHNLCFAARWEFHVIVHRRKLAG